MKKILVLSKNYPNNEGGVTMMYVHTRNIGYKNNGIDVTELNFSAKEDYDYEGIRVITLETYKKELGKYDILVLHAANIVNHYKFLNKYGDNFSRFIFFFHGHEVLKIKQTYPKDYPYVKNSLIKDSIQNLYDNYKLAKWRKKLPKIAYKSDFIFVSKWMKDNFYKYTKINPTLIENKCHITYNSVGKSFENEKYNDICEKKYDFITVRSFLDGSKYCIDVVNRLANNTPNAKFLIIGKGEYFDHYKMASNITLIKQTLKHDELIKYINQSRFALMPTRTDAQGLMACEMIAFGIPLVTSNIEVCHEIFDDAQNVYYIENEDNQANLNDIVNYDSKCIKDERFYFRNTIIKELECINKD